MTWTRVDAEASEDATLDQQGPGYGTFWRDIPGIPDIRRRHSSDRLRSPFAPRSTRDRGHAVRPSAGWFTNLLLTDPSRRCSDEGELDGADRFTFEEFGVGSRAEGF